MIELANGCICCTVAEDFLPALTRLLDRPGRPDHILIETSGLALPKPLLQAFHWPEVKARVTVDGVVAVVDAAALAAGAAPASSADAAARRMTIRSRRCSAISSPAPISSSSTRPICVADAALAAVEAALAARLRPGRQASCARFRAAVAPLAAARPRRGGRGRSRVAAVAATISPATHDHDDFESFVVALRTGRRSAPACSPRSPPSSPATTFCALKGFLDVPG